MQRNDVSAHSPSTYSIQGVHDRPCPRWAFPNPSAYIQNHTLDESAFAGVCRRFTLMNEDLQDALGEWAKDTVISLYSASRGEELDVEKRTEGVSEEHRKNIALSQS